MRVLPHLLDGLPLSDHSDFPSLVEFVRETSLRLVYAVYGFSERLTRHVRRLGYNASTERRSS
jgi:putative mRNA 3-end processing factor